MIYINNLEEAQHFFEALSSPTRVKIVALLQQQGSMNMDALAKSLGLSNGALTSHVKKLSDCGIVNVKLCSVGYGTQKLCSLGEAKFVVDLIDQTLSSKYERLEFNVGQYSSCKINPTCGLCSKEQPLFDFDIPTYFKYPEHFGAELIWFSDGHLCFDFPNPLSPQKKLSEIQLSLELSAEGPFLARDYPATIQFYNHDSLLGVYTSPGEFDAHHGKFTPDWWSYGQYGELVTISIREDGTYINGLEATSYTIRDVLAEAGNDSLIRLKISCENQTTTRGGIMLFGKSFGDHPQGIVMKTFYE